MDKNKQRQEYNPSHFAGYTVMLRGGVEQLTFKQQMQIMEVALLANDYEHLRKYIP